MVTTTSAARTTSSVQGLGNFGFFTDGPGCCPLGMTSPPARRDTRPGARFIRVRSTARRRAGRGRIRWRRVPDHAASQAWWEEPGRVTDFASVGELLKFLRRRARLTQRELGRAVGYTESHISRLEQGQRPADAATLAALFVPALGLDREPALAAPLLELAARRGRGGGAPAGSAGLPALPPRAGGRAG